VAQVLFDSLPSSGMGETARSKKPWGLNKEVQGVEKRSGFK
jgi:hypothetical protein